MSEDFSEIRPKSVPLSHSAPAQQASEPRLTANRVGAAVVIALVIVLAVVVFWVVPELVQPLPPISQSDPEAATTSTLPAAPPTRKDELPPFQTLQKQQARQNAQDQLTVFVELQLQLEEQMQVGEWGQVDYDNAKLLATRGDTHFVKEEFETAIASYAQAAVALEGIIQTGESLFGEALAAGLQALNERDTELATEQFDRALTIDPSDPDALHGRQRSELLPQVNIAMRQAKNHELAGEYADAVAVYRRIENIDPETYGLGGALQTARQGLQRKQIQKHLSVGFSALDRGRLSAAREGFNAALRLDPGNPVALGGIEQTAEQTARNRIETLRRAGINAEQAEEWATALEKYQAVLASDSNIQFAREGRQRSLAQRRVATGLANITTSPEKLSSVRLYSQAQELLAEAQALSPRGPLLKLKIDAVDSLIVAYREPVAVTFVSDNATQVTVSTIGKLGSFDTKQLNLRPGAYTVIGSQDGCLDIRENIVVRPNMEPVEIRCLEHL